MTRDQIIAMAREAGIDPAMTTSSNEVLVWDAETKHLERFASLVAASEREDCAYCAGIALLGADRGLSNRVDQAIRARSKE